jgi:hypothetical protein
MTFIRQRRRPVTHIAELVRRSEGDAPFISESFGDSVASGIGLIPLGKWLHQAQSYLDAYEVWAFDPFRLVSRY